ncbi:MAG: HAMP domain-containing sensor histidine kinase [Chloroflexota bacterium]
MTEASDVIARREKFVRTAAHDLRNPIAALIGYAALIEGELDEENRHFLNRLQETAEKLHYAAASLIELAWLESEMPLEPERVELGGCIAQTIEVLTPLAQEKSITVSASVEDTLPQVTGDEERLRAAIHHVLHNAIVYSEAGKTVAVRAWSEVGKVCCSVTDEGYGIAEQEQERVFDRSFRSADPRVRAVPGGGLGLTVARRILQRHGGDIRTESRLDEGSSFTLRLPAENR